VIPDTFTYNCVFGRPTLTTLDVVASMVRLKMKYHSEEGEIMTIHADLSGVQRLHEAPGGVNTPQGEMEPP